MAPPMLYEVSPDQIDRLLPRHGAVEGLEVDDSVGENNMFSHKIQNLPVHFLKFGVDHQGVIVPMLRRNKSSSLRLDLLVKPLQIRLKDALKSR